MTRLVDSLGNGGRRALKLNAAGISGGSSRGRWGQHRSSRGQSRAEGHTAQGTQAGRRARGFAPVEGQALAEFIAQDERAHAEERADAAASLAGRRLLAETIIIVTGAAAAVAVARPVEHAGGAAPNLTVAGH